MADRIVLNTISYHGHGAIENIVPELTNRGYKKAFVTTDADLLKFGVTKKVTDLLMSFFQCMPLPRSISDAETSRNRHL